MTPVFRSALVLAAAGFLAVGLSGRVAHARAEPGVQQGPPASATAAGDLEVLQLRPNFFMIAGAGGNIAVQVGEDGVVVVDAGLAAKGDAVVAAIKKLTPRPIRYVIDTSA